MTQKELLLKDLCSRLPYGVQCEVGGRRYGPYTFVGDDVEDLMDGRMFKPYLRPLSSMAEEEKKDFLHLINWDENDLIDIIKYPHMYEFTISIKAFDWLNKNHFDYRGLIPMGLAIEVTEETNPYK